MRDRADGQRAKARAMMGGDLASAAAQRRSMGTEMGARPMAVPGVVAKGPPDRYVRPGAPIQTERPPVMLAKGGRVPPFAAKKKAAAPAKKAPSMPRHMAGRMSRMDAKQDKKVAAKAVHRHERHLHKGEPLTKLAKGGKVNCLAAGGVAKVRQGHGQKVPKMPRGGDPQY